MAVAFLAAISHCLIILNLLSNSVFGPFSLIRLQNQLPLFYLYVFELILVNRGLKRKLQFRKKVTVNQQKYTYVRKHLDIQLCCMESYIVLLTIWK